MIEKIISEILTYHRGKFFGILGGLLFGWLVITLGVLQTVFIMCSVYVGYIIGKRLDDNESFKDLLDKLIKKDINH